MIMARPHLVIVLFAMLSFGAEEAHSGCLTTVTKTEGDTYLTADPMGSGTAELVARSYVETKTCVDLIGGSSTNVKLKTHVGMTTEGYLAKYANYLAWNILNRGATPSEIQGATSSTVWDLYNYYACGWEAQNRFGEFWHTYRGMGGDYCPNHSNDSYFIAGMLQLAWANCRDFPFAREIDRLGMGISMDDVEIFNVLGISFDTSVNWDGIEVRSLAYDQDLPGSNMVELFVDARLVDEYLEYSAGNGGFPICRPEYYVANDQSLIASVKLEADRVTSIAVNDLFSGAMGGTICGDVDNDGDFDGADVSRASLALSGGCGVVTGCASGNLRDCADVDGNGSFNADDVWLMGVAFNHSQYPRCGNVGNLVTVLFGQNFHDAMSSMSTGQIKNILEPWLQAVSL